MTIFWAKKGRGVFFVLGGVKVPRVVCVYRFSPVTVFFLMFQE
jgi:hypothetical protein